MADSLKVQQAKAQLAIDKQRQLDALAIQKAQQQSDISSELMNLKQQRSLAALYGGDNYGGGALATKSSGIPLVDAFQQYQNQESAQNPWNIGARVIRQTALPKSDNIWENILGSAAQGLLGGGLNRLGELDVESSFKEDLLPTLRELYPASSIGGADSLDANKMALIAAIGDQTQRDKMNQLGAQFDDNYFKPNRPMAGVGGTSLDARYQELKDLGLGENTTQARLAGEQRKFDDAITKGIPGAYEAAGDFASKSRLIKQGMEDFGDTGPIYGPAKKTALSILNATGLDDVFGVDADKALRGAQAFDVSAWKEAFLNKMPGAITEKELDKMLALGGGVGASKMTNERLAAVAAKLSVIAEEYAKAQEDYIAREATMTGFDREWAAKKKALMGNGVIGVEDAPIVPQGTKPDIRSRLAQIRASKGK